MGQIKEENLQMLSDDQLVFDKPLTFDIYDEAGVLFRGKGRVLRKSDLQRSRRRLRGGLFIDSTAKRREIEQQKEAMEVIRQLKVGDALPCDIFHINGLLLQPAGSKITDRLAQAIRFRQFIPGKLYDDAAKHEATGGITEAQAAARRRRRAAMEENADVPATKIKRKKQEAAPDHIQPGRIAPPEPTTLPSEQELSQTTRDLDYNLLSLDLTHIKPGPPLAQEPQLPLHALREQVESGSEAYGKAVAVFADVATEAKQGKPISIAASNEILDNMLHLQDMDSSMSMLLLDMAHAPNGEYLFNHGMNAALVAMRIAAKQGWSRKSVMQAGTAALFGDLGMLDVHPSIRMAKRALTDEERAEVNEHPKFTVGRLAATDAIDRTVLLIAYQVHERNDATGYPRKRRRNTIHPLARIVSAADLYAAIVAPRPYRHAKTPYEGTTALLHEVRAGRLDRDVARDFLDAISLFPVGSYVRLSDGSNARVLRANNGKHTQPIVVPLNIDGSETDEQLNLVQEEGLSVIATLTHSEATGVATDDPMFAIAG